MFKNTKSSNFTSVLGRKKLCWEKLCWHKNYIEQSLNEMVSAYFQDSIGPLTDKNLSTKQSKKPFDQLVTKKTNWK